MLLVLSWHDAWVIMLILGGVVNGVGGQGQANFNLRSCISDV